MAVLYPIFVALIFNGFDLLTGVLGAVKNHEIQSSKLRDGVFKKVGFIICYILALLIDVYGTDMGINLGVKILPISIAYVIFTECVSIIENISIINPDLLPAKLLELFHLTNKKEDSHSDEEKNDAEPNAK